MKYSIRGKGTNVTLGNKDFITQGGEGKVFGKGNYIYKIYIKPQQKMIPDGKIDELSGLTLSNILNPLDVILDNKNNPVGFTMDWIKDTIPLCKLFTNTFRDDNKITETIVIDIVESLKETINFIHENKCLIVDGNEFNYLIDKEFKVPYFIDVDSYQTKSYPATAIMPSIRDYTNNTFSELTDWYSFAVIACQLFIGTHPYKGKHPKYRKGDFEQRCKDHMSVFNKEVTVSNKVRDFSLIPSNYMDWFIDLFEKGKRIEPPKDGGVLGEVSQKIILITSTDNFLIEDYRSFPNRVSSYKFIFGREVIRTSKEIYIDRMNYRVSKETDILFTKRVTPIFVKIEAGKILFKTLKGKINFPNLNAQEFQVIHNTIYVKNDDKLIELEVNELNEKVVIFVKSTWNIMPNSSKFYKGVIFQNVLGKTHLTIPIPEKSHMLNIHIPELDGCRMLDMKYENGVCIAVYHENNSYNRIILKFNDECQYSLRFSSIGDYIPINFSVLENGVVVLITDDGEMEIFSNQYLSTTIKKIVDPVISQEMLLCNRGSKLKFMKNEKLYNISIK